MTLPTNRTTDSTADEHVADHNQAHAVVNELETHLTSSAAHSAGSVGFSPFGTVGASNVQTAIEEVHFDAAIHVSAITGRHAAAHVSFSPTGTIAATSVQAAITEVSGDVSDHLADASDAHDAAAISFAPAASIAATDVQAALVEVAADAAADLAAHVSDATAAHAAAAISFTPSGTIAATDVQAAILEVAAEAGSSPAVVASAVSFTPVSSVASTNVQDAIAELRTVPEVVRTADYVLALSDLGKVVAMNVATANTLTVPSSTSVAFPVGTVIGVFQYGAGQVTLTPGTGVELRSPGGKLKTAVQYSSATLRKRATDEWVVSGDVST